MTVPTTIPNTDRLDTLRHTIAPGLTDPEFQLFAEIVKATGLNPVTKEIWAIKAGGRLQLMTGINGFLRIANSHPMFDGMELAFDWDGKTLVSATVKVHRKDRKFPAVATAYMAEYSKPTPIWKQMPSVMLSKCAKSLAIREAFVQELGGLYTAEEMPDNFQHKTVELVQPVAVAAPAVEERFEYPTEIQATLAEPGIPLELHTKPEIIDFKPARPVKAATTFYDVSGLKDGALEKSRQYLTECKATEIRPGLWQSPIRLSKLTGCIVTEEAAKDDFPNI